MWANRKPSKKPRSKNVRSKLIAKLDIIFSKYIRLRDSNGKGYFRCISCGRVLPYSQADCGHYINRGHMSTRYNTMNCNAQCRKCNRFMEGNIQGYRRGLIKKYGEPKVELLEAMQNQVCKISVFELEQMIIFYKQEIKKLEDER